MCKITPLVFWELFAGKLPVFIDKESFHKGYFTGKGWSKIIFSFFNSLTSDLSGIVGVPVLYDKEVGHTEIRKNCRIDAVLYYEKIKQDNELIFIEHENRLNTPNELSELDKFAALSTPELKVFIWYYNVYENAHRGVKTNINRQKDAIIQILTKHNITYADNWLFIIGPATHDNPGIDGFYRRIQGQDFQAFTLDLNNGIHLTDKNNN